MKTLKIFSFLFFSISLCYGQFIDGGVNETHMLCDDGFVWASGRNDFGQLGDGSGTDQLEPVQTSNISNIVKVASGFHHAIALDWAGNVWTWGWNNNGQLGNNTTTDKYTPVQVFSDAKGIAGGQYHCLVIKNDGTVWAWGKNSNGQLGNNSTTNSNVPVKVQGLTNVISVSTQYNHCLALKADGTVWAWGYNFTGCAGDGTSGAGSDKLVPVQVSNISNIVDIDAGNGHCLALGNNGNVWSWGGNFYGELGNGNTTNSSLPIQVLTNAIDVAAGSSFSLVLKGDSTVWAWGSNDAGQLGNGQILWAAHPNPAQVSGINNVRYVATGSTHSLAVKNDGSVWAWGNNSIGQLGDSTNTNRPNPIEMHLQCRICTNGSCSPIVSGIPMNSLVQDVIIYPNPTDGPLVIEFGLNLENVTINQRNIVGQIINTSNVWTGNKTTFDVKGVPGVYFVDVTSGERVISRIKVIKY